MIHFFNFYYKKYKNIMKFIIFYILYTFSLKRILSAEHEVHNV
jgi:hypothetical protein